MKRKYIVFFITPMGTLSRQRHYTYAKSAIARKNYLRSVTSTNHCIKVVVIKSGRELMSFGVL